MEEDHESRKARNRARGEFMALFFGVSIFRAFVIVFGFWLPGTPCSDAKDFSITGREWKKITKARKQESTKAGKHESRKARNRARGEFKALFFGVSIFRAFVIVFGFWLPGMARRLLIKDAAALIPNTFRSESEP